MKSKDGQYRASSAGSREEYLFLLLPSFQWLLKILGVSYSCVSNLCLSLCMTFSLCVSRSSPFLIKDNSLLS